MQVSWVQISWIWPREPEMTRFAHVDSGLEVKQTTQTPLWFAVPRQGPWCLQRWEAEAALALLRLPVGPWGSDYQDSRMLVLEASVAGKGHRSSASLSLCPF